jgi:hypothetical protein
LEQAKKKAALSIYSSINSAISINGNDSLCIDLHSLHINEALNILAEFIIPVLPVYRETRLVTGYGKHSNGVSKLKESVKKFLDDNKIKYIVDTSNSGVIKI